MQRINQYKLLWLLLVMLTAAIACRLGASQNICQNEKIASDQMALTAINPNTADWPSLARLPGIGQGKAKAIVKYRQQHLSVHGENTNVFSTADDLKAVKGIGEKTVRNIEPFLSFNE